MAIALELMLALQQAPALGPRLRARDLPEDVLEVIRIAAGDERAIGEAEALTGLAAQALREAAMLYLQQALFCDDADSYRTLGVAVHVDARRIKEHHRWLIHWLHPDRDGGGDLSVFAERVNSAWNDLRTPDRRRAYDLRLRDAGAVAGEPSMPLAVATPVARLDPLLSGRAVRRLPQLVLGAFAGVAAIVLALLVALHADDQALPSPSRAMAQAAEAGSSIPLVEEGRAVMAPSPAVATAPVDPPGAMVSEPGQQAPAGFVRTVAVTAPAHAATSAPTLLSTATVARNRDMVKPPERAIAEQRPAVKTTAQSAKAIMAVATVAATSVSDRTPIPAAPRQSPGTPSANAAVDEPPSEAAPESAPVLAAALLVDAGARPPTPGQAQSTLEHMQAAYRNGDLDALMALFTREQRGRSRETLGREYAELFAHSRERALVLHDLIWLAERDIMIGLGRFDASITPRRGGRARLSSGAVRVELRTEQGQTRIVHLSHDAGEP